MVDFKAEIKKHEARIQELVTKRKHALLTKLEKLGALDLDDDVIIGAMIEAIELQNNNTNPARLAELKQKGAATFRKNRTKAVAA